VRKVKVKANLDTLPPVYCEGVKLKYVAEFPYLGNMLSGCGESMADLNNRMAKATGMFVKLLPVLKDKQLSLKIRLGHYKICVCSSLRYSCEAWNFGEAEKAKINGFNARCLAQITGEDRRKMAENPPYNLTTGIQRTRLIWRGHVLRMPENHPTRQGLLVYLSTLTTNNYPAGSIMENAPNHKNAAALIQFAVGDGSEKGM
jgi:hypothetical protein